jgi:hypothetical protein
MEGGTGGDSEGGRKRRDVRTSTKRSARRMNSALAFKSYFIGGKG